MNEESVKNPWDLYEAYKDHYSRAQIVDEMLFCEVEELMNKI